LPEAMSLFAGFRREEGCKGDGGARDSRLTSQDQRVWPSVHWGCPSFYADPARFPSLIAFGSLCLSACCLGKDGGKNLGGEGSGARLGAALRQAAWVVFFDGVGCLRNAKNKAKEKIAGEWGGAKDAHTTGWGKNTKHGRAVKRGGKMPSSRGTSKTRVRAGRGVRRGAGCRRGGVDHGQNEFRSEAHSKLFSRPLRIHIFLFIFLIRAGRLHNRRKGE